MHIPSRDQILTTAKSAPAKGVGFAMVAFDLVWFLGVKLGEHVILTWVAEHLGESVSSMPFLLWSVKHPFQLYIALAASYCVFILVVAKRSPNEHTRNILAIPAPPSNTLTATTHGPQSHAINAPGGKVHIDNSVHGSGGANSDYPRLVMSSVGSGEVVQVETLGMEATNVRLVPIQSENYQLRSEIIRYLLVGKPENLKLRCESKPEGDSRKLFSPALFFQDLYPGTQSTDIREVLEHALTLFNERQLAVKLELAYSTHSGAEHYRHAFKVRWDTFQDEINDIEPLGVRKDDDPPSSAPPNVML